jgi:hypothetical protein
MQIKALRSSRTDFLGFHYDDGSQETKAGSQRVFCVNFPTFVQLLPGRTAFKPLKIKEKRFGVGN